MALYETKIYIDGATFSEFEVEAVFEIETEVDWDERGRKGLSATSWNLLHINFDGFHVGRSDVERMLGKSRLQKIESDAAESALDDSAWRAAA